MTIYVLIREDRNDHGFVDTSIVGLFRSQHDVKQSESAARARALDEGLRVDDDESSDIDWQVSWKVEEHEVSQPVPSRTP